MTAIDNCSGEITVTPIESIVAGNCENSFTITRTWTFTDSCNNTSSVSQTITVQDVTNPVFSSALPQNIVVECDNVPAAVTLTAVDNCGEVNISFNETSEEGSCPGRYTITRTWTASDLCNNTISHTQVITVQDSTNPVFNEELPADVIVECHQVPVAVTLTASDNCGEATVSFTETIAPGFCPGAFTVTRTWTATDACNNVSSHTQIISVQDTTAPSFAEELPLDITVECTNIPLAPAITAVDNCDVVSVNFSEVILPGNCENNYVIRRTWTSTDSCKNMNSHIQNITVQDTIAPSFNETLPTNVTVACNEIPNAVTLTATDTCSEAVVTFNETTQAGECSNSYTLVRTWTATDNCGNFVSHTQLVEVNDTIAPVFTSVLPQNLTVECSEVPEAETVTATDSCGEVTINFTENIENGSCAGEYTITRTWIAVDACGNQVTHTQVVTVEDNSAPTASQYQTLVNVTCENVPAVPQIVFTDSCTTDVTVTFSEEETNQSTNGYTLIRTWIVSDDCGNAETFTQTVNVTIDNSILPLTFYAECNNEDVETRYVNLNTLAGNPTGGSWVDVNGTGSLNDGVFNPYLIPVGVYKFRYEITGVDCPRTIEVDVTVDDDCPVLPCSVVNIYNAMSPNGDGLNDIFLIENIENSECYLNNTVEIYNRWGVLVYDAKNYDNSSVVFRGVSEGRATVNKSAELPTGTYFYIIQYTTTDGSVVNKSGYLYLTR